MKRLFNIFLTFIFFISTASIVNAQVFIKKDDKGNIVKDAIFIQTRLDGSVVANISNKKVTYPNSNDNLAVNAQLDDGQYPYIDYSEDKELSYSLLTSEQKEILSNIRTLNDYNQFVNSLPDFPMTNACTPGETEINYFKKSKGLLFPLEGSVLTESNIISNKKYNAMKLQSTSPAVDNKTIEAMSFMFIEEVKVPYKLEKEIMVVPIVISISYNVMSDNSMILENATMSSPYGGMNNNMPVLYKYNNQLDYNKAGEIYSLLSDDEMYTTTCGVPTYPCDNGDSNLGPLSYGGLDQFEGHVKIPSVKISSCYPIVIDKTNEEDITKKATIESYVDGKQRAHSTQNGEVTITVKLTNTAKTPLYENVVVSNIPEGFEYVDASAIKEGVYNRENNTITWNLDYLDANDSELYSYKVKVPNTADLNKLYNTTAQLSTKGIDTPIVSDEAVVDLGSNETSTDVAENPKTGSFNEIILILIAFVSTAGLIYLFNIKSIKQNL